MAISDKLFLAILAMDAYNRGYNAGIVSDPDRPREGLIGTQIGNATLGIQSVTTTGSEAVSASFFAQSYRWNGKTVISYRGTDDPTGTDLWRGWSIGTGWTPGTQAGLAIQFYESILNAGGGNRTVFDAANPNVVLTGHSLGGGLGGFVGTLYGSAATLFDNMPYAAAENDDAVCSGRAAA